MTSQAQIQALIDQIDRVLNKTSPRLPWVMSGDMAQQRQVLEQTRNYLLALQQQPGLSEGYGASGLYSHGSQYQQPYPQPQAASAESPQQVLQAVLQEMNYLRRNMMQPLRSEVEMLQQQKAVLAQEVQRLEAQRQQYAFAQQQPTDQRMIAEYIQTAINRLQDNLNSQLAQMQGSLQGQAAQGGALPGSPTGMVQPPLNTVPIQTNPMAQEQTDQFLLQLDSTLRTVFDSLLSDVRSYQESLRRELEKMHNMGQQGEALFTALLNRLAKQLGREASSYLQALDEQRTLPGRETSLDDRIKAMQSMRPEDITEAEIDQLLDELTSGQPAGGVEPVDRPQPSPPPPPNPYTSDANLDLLGLDLDNLQLETPPAGSGAVSGSGEDVTRFQLDPPEPLSLNDDDDVTQFQFDQLSPLPMELDEDDITLFQVDDDDDLTQLQADEPVSFDLGSTSRADVGDLGSAFDMLNQLGVGLNQPSPSTPAPDVMPSQGDVGTPPANPEIDELYESLFGSTSEEGIADEAELFDSTPFAEPIAEAEAPQGDVADQLTGSAPLTPPEDDQSLAASSFEDLLFDASETEDSTPFAQPIAEAEAPRGVSPNPADLTSDPLSSVEDDLFGGISEADTGFAATPPSPTATNQPQMLEDFLFSSEDEVVTPETATQSPDAPDNIESIAALSDLIAASDNPSPTVDQFSPNLPAEDDTFITAAPEEDLLVNEEPQSEARVDFRLAADTLQQLTADLSSLEGLEVDPTDSTLTPSEEINWSSDQWTGIDQTQPEPATSIGSEPLFESAPLDTLDFSSLNQTGADETPEYEVPMAIDMGQSTTEDWFEISESNDVPDLPADLPTEQPNSINTINDLFADESPSTTELSADRFPGELDLPFDSTTANEPITGIPGEANEATVSSPSIDRAFLDELFGDSSSSVEEPTTTVEGLMDESASSSVSLSDAALAALFSDEAIETETLSTPTNEQGGIDLFSDAIPSEPTTALQAGIPLSDSELTISGFGREIDDAPTETTSPSAESMLTLDDFAETVPATPPATEPSGSETTIDDLFAAEDVAAAAPQAPQSNPAETELTLADFESAPPTAADSTPSTFTLEGLDQLFEDLPPTGEASGEEAIEDSALDDLFSDPEGSTPPGSAEAGALDSESLEKKNNPGF